MQERERERKKERAERAEREREREQRAESAKEKEKEREREMCGLAIDKPCGIVTVGSRALSRSKCFPVVSLANSRERERVIECV